MRSPDPSPGFPRRTIIKRMSKWIALAFALSLCAACATDTSTSEARRLVDRGALALDVRGPDEFARGHADGAVNIPITDIDRRMSELPRARPIVVYCHSGVRAAIAESKLRKAGYDAHNVGTLEHLRKERAANPPSLF